MGYFEFVSLFLAVGNTQASLLATRDTWIEPPVFYPPGPTPNRSISLFLRCAADNYQNMGHLSVMKLRFGGSPDKKILTCPALWFRNIKASEFNIF